MPLTGKEGAMVHSCEKKSDYEVMITEEYFPFWDDETKGAWAEGLKAFAEVCGCNPEADIEDHKILCFLVVDKRLVLRHPLAEEESELFRGLDEVLVARTLCYGFEYFIATAGVTRKLLIAMERKRCTGVRP